MGDIQTLMDMGFDKEKAEYALKVTNGVEPAMEWLLAHVDDEIPKTENTGNTVGASPLTENNPPVDNTIPKNAADTETATETEAQANDDANTSKGEAKSLKCDDCGKVFRDNAEVEFHAIKSGHLNFSESSEEKKPLTEEEKKEQMALIEQKLKQKRVEREEREKAEELEREKNRISSGKHMTEARRRMEDLEMKKILEQRKREKAEEKAARDRVRAQIEADKVARKARENPQANEATSPVSSTTPPSTSTVLQESKAKAQTPREYTETRIQIRLWDGKTITQTFNVKEQLSAIRVFIQMNTDIETPFSLMTPFPRKLFTDDDYEKPLDALGLVPSAVLVLTKAG